MAGLINRHRNKWQTLIAIADQVGGTWPDAARKAAVALSDSGNAQSISTDLLTDIRECWLDKERRDGGESRHMPTNTVLQWLHGLDDRPWNEWGRARKPMTPHALAKLLSPFQIRSRNVQKDHTQMKAYLRKQMVDAWDR